MSNETVRKIFKVTPEQDRVIKELANEAGLSESEIMREALASLARKRQVHWPRNLKTHGGARNPKGNPNLRRKTATTGSGN